MLLEGEYKSIARGEFELSKVLSLLRQLKSRNPLEADPQLPRGYNALNRDGGMNSVERINGSNSCGQGSCERRCTVIYIHFCGG